MTDFKTDLPQNLQMEQYHVAYVHALSSCCGWNFSIESPDYDGIDARITGRYTDESGMYMRPEIHVQLKSTTTLVEEGEYLKYKLRVENYNLLCGANDVVYPRYLLVLDIDEDAKNWIIPNENAIVLSKKCYWISLQEYGYSSNKSNVTIKIPKNQILDRDTLNNIMKAAAKGGSI